MKVLIIKMSSMGDVIHAMPALMDAALKTPDVCFHWLVEESFAELPRLHKQVARTQVVRLRAWRKNWLKAFQSREPQRLIRRLRNERYDLIIDAQGLLKSAILAKLIKAPIHGLDLKSAREPLAARFYHHRYLVPKNLHAVERVRALFAKVFAYQQPVSPPDYGLLLTKLNTSYAPPSSPFLVFLHNTTWESKLWPEPYWQELTSIAVAAGFRVMLTSGNEQEYERALRIKGQHQQAQALKRLSISEVIQLLSAASGVVSVDTGFAQLAGALQKPNLSLFGPTNPSLSRPYGLNQTPVHATLPCAPCLKRHCRIENSNSQLNPPCFQEMPPRQIWAKLEMLLN